MKIPLSWLKAYVDIDLPAKELAHRLTMAGLEAEGTAVIGGSWDNIFVGDVVAVEPHPNADRLRLATVALGDTRFTSVCGAPNVAAGQRIAFAKPGAKLFDPDTGHLESLKAARIRGVASEGMVCSERELGLGENHTGILVLDKEAPLGAPLTDHLGDVVLDLAPTTNRPDWLSVLGVAHEVAALTGSKVREPGVDYPEAGQSIEGLVTVRVEAPDLAPRYTASLITGVQVGAAPQWMQERLLKAGQRSINNIVDITNYVMLEYGQPLHAFDYHLLAEKTVLVRRARPGEMLVSLDGETRRLSSENLVIADASRAIGLAGVMGGTNTEIGEATTAVLLESASFSATGIRRTAAALRLRTEASTRFERNLNPELAPLALRRATRLIQELAGGQVAHGIFDIDTGHRQQAAVRLTPERVERVLGVRFSLEEAERVLTSLGFQCRHEGEAALLVTVPYWRSDIVIEDDLVEELARISGYKEMPTTFLSQSIPPHRAQPLRTLRERVKDLLAAAGMQETISYSLTSSDTLQKVGAFRDDVQPLKAANPMTSEREYLRTSLRGSILNTLATNQRHGETSLRLFEVGRVYLPQPEDLPQEQELAVGVFLGSRSPVSWAADEGSADFYDAKGTVEAVVQSLGGHPEFRPAHALTLHPGRTAEVLVEGRRVGVVGEVLLEVLERFDISGGTVALFELDLEALAPPTSEQPRRFTPLARFPGAYRDMALVVAVDIPVARLTEIIQRYPLVESATVFDVYTGPGLSEEQRSLAFRIHFRSARKTLTASAVNEAQEQILRELEQETGAKLR